MADTALPTEKLELRWPEGVEENEASRDEFNDSATAAILDFAAELRARGERAWFEVWYLGFPGRTDLDEQSFDAVEVDSEGNISTLPPYAELEVAS